MSQSRNRFILTFLSVLFVASASAQVNLPFTQKGLGVYEPTGFSTTRSMGRIAAGYNEMGAINPVNPASYANNYLQILNDSGEVLKDIRPIRNTSLEIGFSSVRHQLSDNVNTYSSSDGNLSYLAFSAPIGSWAGFSVGFMPSTNLGYTVSTSFEQEGIGAVRQTSTGSGATNKGYLGFGAKKLGLAIGANINYHFGLLTHRDVRQFDDQPQAFGIVSTVDNNVSGFQINGGLQYEFAITNDITMVVGAYGSNASTLQIQADTMVIRAYNIANPSVERVDLIDSLSGTSNFQLPATMGFGFTLKQGKQWLLGVDYKIDAWEGVANSGVDYRNMGGLSIGGQFVPKPGASSIWNKASYRAGYFTGNQPHVFNNNVIKETGISFGMSIPMKRLRDSRVISAFDIGFEYGSMGSITDNSIATNFFRVNLGLNLNTEHWFIPSKFN